MIQIRSNVFETNSSSTHSICISKKEPKIGSYVHFGLGEYGWSNREVNPADYLYTAIMCQDGHEELLDKLKGILDSYGIMYDFEKPVYDEYGWLDNGYIDHGYDTYGFINAVLNNEDMLMRLLFNSESTVYTGNDNQEGQPNGCNIADEYMWVYDNDDDWHGKEVPNPYHDEENFDYFYKCN